MEGSTPDPTTDFPLTDFAGSHYRITDATIEIRLTQGVGPTSFILSDKNTGTWVRVVHQLAVGQVVTVDCSPFLVTLTSGGQVTSLTNTVSRGGESPLLALTPYSISEPPILRLAANEPFDGILQVNVVGRRKYVMA
jgi:hypothetical protein